MSKLLAAAVGLMLVALPAWAVNPQEEIDTIEAQIQVLKKRGELNNELSRLAGSTFVGLPKIVAIIGDEKGLIARLQFNGIVSNYREGDTLRQGMRVASITRRQVTMAVGEGKKVRGIPLDFIAGGELGVPGQPVGSAPLPNGRLPVPPELLPDPPAVGARSTEPKATGKREAAGKTAAESSGAPSAPAAPKQPASGAVAGK